MDDKTAAVLLASLMERIDRDATVGTISSLERAALQLALKALQGDSAVAGDSRPVPVPLSPSDTGPAAVADQGTEAPAVIRPAVAASPQDSIAPAPSEPVRVALVLDSVAREAPTDPEVLLSLDFGTAMSKAFASVGPDEYLDLALGAAAGRQGYPVPSTVFIGDDGKAYFGFEALELSQDLVGSGRERLDSIKGWLSLRREGNLDGEACILPAALNPTTQKLTQGDLIRIYLAYLTDVAETALHDRLVPNRQVGRYVKRRYARPCWPDAKQAAWADRLMRTMLAEAQVLADTFTSRWAGGIDVAELKSALDQVKALAKRPDYLIDEGVPEPVAVAAGAIGDSENLRDAFMVVDVGAGTTDFGLFVATRRPGAHNDAKVFQVPASIHGLMQAGDRVDGLLRQFIARKESVDETDTSGRVIMADLARRMRGLKETLFMTGSLQYALADGTVGKITLEEFLASDTVKKFGRLVEDGFRDSLERVDESWLRWLAMDGVRLHVVITGGSSPLPMMQALGKGPIDVKGYKIMRDQVDPRPEWMHDVSDALQAVYPQLAVAIGGAAEEMPETLNAPPVFAGGSGPARYVAGSMQLSGT